MKSIHRVHYYKHDIHERKHCHKDCGNIFLNSILLKTEQKNMKFKYPLEENAGITKVLAVNDFARYFIEKGYIYFFNKTLEFLEYYKSKE